MIDFHCHLDLYPDPLKIFEEVKSRKEDVLAVTTSPRAYLKTSAYFSGAKNLRVALGFHPELVAERPNEWELFLNSVKNNRYIGEIGIDGSRSFQATLDVQTNFFEDAMAEAEKCKGRIISIHTRDAENRVLTVIERTINLNKPILHWFTGTTREIDWAVELGCWFSINPKMCTSKHGRELISRIPMSRILPETDGPFVRIGNKPCVPWDRTVYDFISATNRVSISYVERLFNENLNILEADE